MVQWLEPLSDVLATRNQCWLESWLLHFQSNSLLTLLGKQQTMALGPLLAPGETRLLVLARFGLTIVAI